LGGGELGAAMAPSSTWRQGRGHGAVRSRATVAALDGLGDIRPSILLLRKSLALTDDLAKFVLSAFANFAN
jgi:hypothetical protein